MSYTLSIDGASPVSLSSLNAIDARITENIVGETSLELNCSQAFDSANICPPFGKVVLYDSTNTIRFVGWLDKVNREASSSSHSATYVFNGALRWLERTYYTQNRAGVVLVGGTAGGGTTFPAQAFSDVYNNIMQSGGASFTYQSAGTIQSIYPIDVPTRLRSDVTAADALTTLLQFTPTACLRWTYPTTTPLLTLIRADETTDGYINSATHQLVSAGLTPRYDLLADSIVVFFMRDDAVVGSSTFGPQYGQGTGGIAGALGANRKIVITYDVSVINNLPSAGLAQVMASWYQRLHIDGSVEKYSIDWNDYAGQLLGFSGGLFAPFSAYNSLLKSITRDLLKGTTKMDLGVYPARVIYKVGDYDTPAPATPQVINNQPFTPPASGISYGGTNNSTFNSDGFSTNGSINGGSVSGTSGTFDSIFADTATITNNGSFGSVTSTGAGDFGSLTASGAGQFGSLTVTGAADLQGTTTTEAITANGTINANSTGDSINAGGKVKATKFEATDGTAPIIVNGVTYKELQIERCDGKKVKILADSAGWA